MVFVADNQTSEVVMPCRQALNLPSAPIRSKLPSIFGFRLLTPFAMRCNHFNNALGKKLIVNLIAVVCFIANQLIGRLFCNTAIYGGLDELYLVGPVSL